MSENLGAAEQEQEVAAEPEAGSLEALRLGVVGRWQGSARLLGFEFPEIGPGEVLGLSRVQMAVTSSGEYSVLCLEDDVCDPMPGRGLGGRYALTDQTFNGAGWGVMEDLLEGGDYDESVDLEQVRLLDEGKSLHFERIEVDEPLTLINTGRIRVRIELRRTAEPSDE